MRVSVFGLGKLGAPIAATLAEGGASVVGCDVDLAVVDAINRGLAPVVEPGLAELIARNRARLRATADSDDAIANSDVTFIIVPTPSAADGALRNELVIEAAERIGLSLRRKNDYHVVVVSSTVMPGSCDGPIWQTIERASGRRVGPDRLGLCYSPKFVALGSVVRDLTYPDFVLIGESDARAGAAVEEVHRRSCPNRPQVDHMSLVNAEIAKIAVNSFVTMKISFANLLGEICERAPGADAATVAAAIGHDRRIGRKYLQPALGFGGPCFPRDSLAFAAAARSLGVTADLADATRRINDRQVERIVGRISGLLPQGAKVAVLGLAYKPDTPVVERSQGIEIARHLADAGARVTVHDPQALEAARSVLGATVQYAERMADAVRDTAMIIVSTPWPIYRGLAGELPAGRSVTVLDCWRLFDRAAFQDAADIELIQIGRADAASASGRSG